ncbi:competence type IV pilus minor pilin ComGD [Alkalicoccobacillus porphyridii]|uniref:Prepilin-type N-terminal cleavage/methylation domain-containing protein n=1 Tax=Alkalicoccobacillus porphyridii TaxID=2597270 RepID=A0A553ZTQ3_9BACI|nr:competence type IV pilus minor pilin ComGD [Alkalicoccobacillus porphyridii]TSB44725.1 prepilin-type N-terminal cleavage/methylation domain-containing protein [Alkalicoccobacillus porphyridii]
MNEQGHTLLEMLITLSLLSILTTLPLLLFSNVREQHEASYTAWQLKQDYMIAQHAAMARGEMVSLRGSANSYRVRLNDGSAYILRQYSSPDMTLLPLTLTANFVSFNSNGNPRNAGRVLFRTHGREYVYVIQIGKGRIRYSEQ